MPNNISGQYASRDHRRKDGRSLNICFAVLSYVGIKQIERHTTTSARQTCARTNRSRIINSINNGAPYRR